MVIKTPSRFARINRWVYEPSWGPLASHDVPFSDGVSGQATITITARTELLVGGARASADENTAGEVLPFQLPDGTYAIPGSALQGLARSKLEIAAFGRLGPWVDDRKFGIRDLSKTATARLHYQSRLSSSVNQPNNKPARVTMNSLAGWLVKTPQGPQVVPCKYARIHVDEVIKLRQSQNTAAVVDEVADTGVIDQRTHAKERYDWFLGTSPKDRLNAEFSLGSAGWHLHQKNQKKPIEIKYDRFIPALPGAAGTTDGTLVLTGKPNNGLGEGVKKWEFVFYPSRDAVGSTGPFLELDDKAWAAFLLLHAKQPGRDINPNWDFWKCEYEYNRPIPIFYWKAGGKVETLGMAFAFKAAHKNSTHDLLENSAAAHVEPLAKAELDLPHLIFGAAAEAAGGRGLKRRAWFGTALCQARPGLKSNGPNAILLSPKPSYVGIYVRQTSVGNAPPHGEPLATYSPAQGADHLSKPELAGVKLWPAANRTFNPHISVGVQDNMRVQTKLNRLPVGTVFKAPLTFHNLRPVELGALLWVLSYGDPLAFGDSSVDATLRHRLGMGKPYGLGEVAIRVTLAVDGDARTAPNFVGLFTKHMTEKYPGPGSWQDSKQVRALLEAANPAQNTAAELTYMELGRPGLDGTYVGEKGEQRFLSDYVSGGEVQRTTASQRQASTAQNTPVLFRKGQEVTVAGESGIVETDAPLSAIEVNIRFGSDVEWTPTTRIDKA